MRIRNRQRQEPKENEDVATSTQTEENCPVEESTSTDETDDISLSLDEATESQTIGTDNDEEDATSSQTEENCPAVASTSTDETDEASISLEAATENRAIRADEDDDESDDESTDSSENHEWKNIPIIAATSMGSIPIQNWIEIPAEAILISSSGSSSTTGSENDDEDDEDDEEEEEIFYDASELPHDLIVALDQIVAIPLPITSDSVTELCPKRQQGDGDDDTANKTKVKRGILKTIRQRRSKRKLKKNTQSFPQRLDAPTKRQLRERRRRCQAGVALVAGVTGSFVGGPVGAVAGVVGGALITRTIHKAGERKIMRKFKVCKDRLDQVLASKGVLV